MDDRSQFRRRYLLNLITSNGTMYPIGVGVALLCGGLVAGLPLLAFAGGMGAAVALGVCATRFLAGDDDGRIAQATHAELQREATQALAGELNDLEQSLTKAVGPRAAMLLRGLRELIRPFVAVRAGQDDPLLRGIPQTVALDIASKVIGLFEQCVETLRQTHELASTTMVTSDAARAAYRERREALLNQVDGSIRQIEGAIATMQSFGGGDHDTAELSRVQEELREGLEVAQRVDARMRTLDSPGYDPREYENVDR